MESLRTLGSTFVLGLLCPLVAAAGPSLDLRGLDKIDLEPVTGRVLLQRVDLDIGEVEQRFQLTRTYAPGAGDPETFGGQWATLLDAHLERSSPAHLVFVDAEGRRHRFLQQADKRFVAETGALSIVEATDEGHVLVGLSQDTYRFDTAGRLIERRRPGLRVTLERDARGRVQRVVGPWGTIKARWSANDQLQALEAPGGRRLGLVRNGLGQLVRVEKKDLTAVYDYDDLGRLTELAEGKATIGYDEFGRAVSLGGEGVIPLRLTYLPANDPVRGDEVRIDRGGQVSSLFAAPGGRAFEEVSPTGARSLTEFDERGRRARYTEGARMWTWSYDDGGRLERAYGPGVELRYRYDGSSQRLARISAADGRAWSFDYDANGLLVRSVSPDRGETRLGYDGADRLISLTNARGATTFLDRNAHGYITGIETTGVGSTRIARRADGSVKGVRAHDGTITKVLQRGDGHAVRVASKRGVIRERTYDARGQLIASRDARGHTVRYAWDLRGRMVLARDEQGVLARFEYDRAGRLSAITDANRNRVTYERPDPLTLVVDDPSAGVRITRFDAYGRPVEQTRGGQRLRYEYDEQGHLVRRRTPRGTEHFDYDVSGRLRALRGRDGGFELSYDRQGRLAKVTNTELEQSVSYAYDAAGDRSEVRLPWGTVRYERDTAGRVTAVTTPEGERIVFGLDHAGRRRSIRYPNGVTTEFGYELDRLTRITTRDADGTLVDGRGYEWDGGRLTSVTDRSGAVTRFDYDARGRLVRSSSSAETVRYAYDAGGNRRSAVREGEATLTRVGSGNRALKHGARQLSYGPTGALRESREAHEATHYVYDHDDRLVRVELPDGRAVRYGYAPNGVRLWRQSGGERTRFLSDLHDVVGEYAGRELVTSYVQGPGADDVLAARHKGQSHYYHFDVVRSVTSMTDAKGKVSARYDYSAFGQARETEGPAAEWNVYRYTSRSLDREAGLYHYRARAYDPDLGRFTSPDPHGRAGGLNLYAYADNAPTQFNDPLGLWPGQGLVSGFVDGVKDAGGALKDGVVDVAEGAYNLGEDIVGTAWDHAQTAGNLYWNYTIGFANGVWSGLNGIAQMITNPVATVQGLIELVKNPGAAWDAITAKWDEYVDAFFNDPEKFARMTGHLAGEVALAIVGTKGTTAAASAARGAVQAGRAARAASAVDDVARAGSVADDAARVGANVADDAARTGANAADDAGRTGAGAADETGTLAEGAGAVDDTSVAASSPNGSGGPGGNGGSGSGASGGSGSGGSGSGGGRPPSDSRGAAGALDELDGRQPRPDARPVPDELVTSRGRILTAADDLDHVLEAHTIENFVPATRLGKPNTTLFKPGTITNRQELVRLVQQALDKQTGVVSRTFEVAKKGNQTATRTTLDMNLRGNRVTVVLEHVDDGALKLVTAHPTRGPGTIRLTQDQVSTMATLQESGVSLDRIRTMLANGEF